MSYAYWDAAVSLTAPWLQATGLGEPLHLDANSTLYRQGDTLPWFYLLRTGFVHVTYVRANGTPMLVEILGPGAMFGEAPAMTGMPRSVTATTVTRAVLSRYHASELDAIVRQHPELALALLKLQGFKNLYMVRKLTRIASSDPEERVLELLARVARLETSGSHDGAVADLTHEQIAAMMALSRVTVTRTLKALAQRGLVETEPGRVIVRDRVALLARLRGK